MTKGLLPAALAEQLAEPPLGADPSGVRGSIRAGHDSDSAIRLLGADNSGGTTPPFKGATSGSSPPPHGTATESDQSETRVGLRMDSIDDDWDLDQLATTNAPAVSSAPARVVPVNSTPPVPADAAAQSPSQAPVAGRFGSPLGLASPVANHPATVPPPAAPAAAPPTVASAQESASDKSLPASKVPASKVPASKVPASKVPASKVQLAADAFRRKAGISATPSTAPGSIPQPAPSVVAKPAAMAPVASVVAKAPEAMPEPSVQSPALVDASEPSQPTVIVSPVVVLEEPLELHEISPSVPPPVPEEALAASKDASKVVLTPPVRVVEAETTAAAPKAESKVVGEAAVVASPQAESKDIAEIAAVASPQAIAKTESIDVVDATALPAPAPAAAAAPKVDAVETVNQQATAAVALVKSKDTPSGKQATAAKNRDSSSTRVAQSRNTAVESKSDKSKPSAGHATQDSHLSLDTDYAVEFFSSPPPPAHVNVEIAQDIIHDIIRDTRHARTPEQVARQLYLRRLVLKVMFVAIAFVAIVVYTMWHRGLLRLTP